MKADLRSMTPEELQKEMESIGEAKFRAKQIFRWLHVKYAENFEEMTDLSENLRNKLNDNYIIGGVKIVRKLVSKEDNTTKYLFELENNYIIESVFMQYSYGNTVCISTQAGCRMGCTFCASTLDGVEKSLTPAEMLAQIYAIEKDKGEKVSGVVLMGSREPLDKYENVLKFIKLINCKDGKNMGQRHITLSLIHIYLASSCAFDSTSLLFSATIASRLSIFSCATPKRYSDCSFSTFISSVLVFISF